MPTVRRGKQQFQGVFNEMWTVKETLNLAAAADSGFAAADVTVPGVRKGDMVLGVTVNVDITDGVLSASVPTADTVTIVLTNDSGSEINLATADYKILVGRPDF